MIAKADRVKRIVSLGLPIMGCLGDASVWLSCRAERYLYINVKAQALGQYQILVTDAGADKQPQWQKWSAAGLQTGC